jgi:hypothetical protein
MDLKKKISNMGVQHIENHPELRIQPEEHHRYTSFETRVLVARICEGWVFPSSFRTPEI